MPTEQMKLYQRERRAKMRRLAEVELDLEERVRALEERFEKLEKGAK